ncbi:MAG: filamentous hemagglutinin N-terminal domain-containing protein [Cyanobacteria bacterium J06573_2]
MFNLKASFLGLSFALAFIQVCQVNAQLIPDDTLGKENSLVNSIKSLEDRIDGGAIRGSHLFHSFKEFNIDNNRSVYFNHPTQVKNILTRVTGNNVSQILGKLGVLGNANLFLINPNGVIFGEDASFDIKTSFVGTNSTHINFADGTEFSAVLPDTKPLLTISAPIGFGTTNNLTQKNTSQNNQQLISSKSDSIIKESAQFFEVKTEQQNFVLSGNILLKLKLFSFKSKPKRFELGNVASGLILTNENQKIIPMCGRNKTSNFTVTGRGGLPENPSQLFTAKNPIVNLINLVSSSDFNSNSISYNPPKDNHKKSKKEIVEAKGWIVDAQGNIKFVAEIPRTVSSAKTIFRANCQSLG